MQPKTILKLDRNWRIVEATHLTSPVITTLRVLVNRKSRKGWAIHPRQSNYARTLYQNSECN